MLRLPEILHSAIRGGSFNAVAKDEEELRSMLAMALDVVENGISSVASICRKLAVTEGEAETEQPRNVLLSTGLALSDVNQALCDYQGCQSTAFEDLFKTRKILMFDQDVPAYEAMLGRLQFWLSEVANNAQRIDAALSDDVADVGEGYLTNIPMLPADLLPGDLEERDEILDGYKEVGISVFAMPYDDYNELLKELFARRFGGFDSSDKTHVLLMRKMKALCVPFEHEIEGFTVECIALFPSVGKGLYRPYSSLEKRWIVDIPYISSLDIERIMEIAKREQWAAPGFLDAAEEGVL